MEIYNNNRKVIVGTREVMTDKARPVDKIMLVLMFIEVFGTVILSFIFTPLVIPFGLIATYITVIVEIFYFTWSRYHRLPSKVIWIFIAIVIYMIMLVILFLTNSPLFIDAVMGIFLIVGLGLSVGAIFSCVKTGKYKTPVNAVCVNIETEQRIATDSHGHLNTKETWTRPVFSFNYNGKDFTVKKDYYEAKKLKAGDKVTLYINSNNPNEFRYQKGNSWGVLLATGIMFILIWLLTKILLMVLM